MPGSQTVEPPAAVNPPQVAATCPRGPIIQGPGLSGEVVGTNAFYKAPPPECSGTFLLEASQDRANWKTLSAVHVTVNESPVAVTLSHQCVSGTWFYRSVFASADGAVKSYSSDGGGTPKFKC